MLVSLVLVLMRVLYKDSTNKGFRVVVFVQVWSFKGSIVDPKKLETGFRTISAGIPCALLLRIEAIGFPTFWLLFPTPQSLAKAPPRRTGPFFDCGLDSRRLFPRHVNSQGPCTLGTLRVQVPK